MNVILVPGFNPGPYTGAGNNTYLLPGSEPTLIDSATGDPRHVAALEQGLGASKLARVLVTHAHVDHAAGCKGLAERWPAAEFVKIPWPQQDARYPVDWRAMRDGEHVAAGDSRLRVVHTPGHAPDHACLFDEVEGVLFCGDLLVEGGTVVIPAGFGGSLTDYLASLQRVLELAPARVLPAHGPEIEDVGALVRHYFERRQQREEQVVAALRAGCATLEAITGRIYDELPANLRRPAAETVCAHLVKLRDEGRAREEEAGRWVLVQPGRPGGQR